ncbi:hypothetical protein LLH23_16500 [bacterium]|nr:hypothetical protein [bacterium]
MLLLLVGCRPAPPPTTTQPAPSRPAVPRWQWLHPDELQATEALIAVVDRGAVAADAPKRQAFLKTYAAAFAELSEANAPVLPVLQRLWELGMAARRARLSAGEVRRAVGLGKAAVPPAARHATREQPVLGVRLLSPGMVDPAVRRLLRAVKTGEGSYAGFVSRWVRRVVIVEDPAFLSPDLPLKCEGAAEVWSGTVFLTARDPITGQPRPPWKVAAALVHEAEHIRWAYAVAGDDPRLLYKAPDERNAYREMFVFLREVRLSPSGRAGGATEAAAISADMHRWRAVVERANTLLGYPTADLSQRTEALVADEALMTDPMSALPATGAAAP